MESAAFTIDVFKFVLLIFSLSVHECSHAWMASRLGDQTARLQGRVTLNPIYHIDPVGTLIMPAIIIFGPLIGFSLFSGILIGWAKPTPVISRNFTKIRRDENMVTLAGPASNMLLAIVATIVLLVVIHSVAGGRQVVMLTASGMLMPGVNSSVQAIVLLGIAAVEINLALFFFNLLPIPPLDGSNLLRNILPYNAVQSYDRIPMWVSWCLMIFVGGYIMRLLLSPAFAVVGLVLSKG
ncbi:site-2 protease family protein [Telmatobacter sp. DSM 110680]|uniref:Site-2 protease family protein n=1 Tax=Telmatobacter sp. DSM 110680 TaxID=3036704 RepID=A0AAU7DMJ3_9BACT